MDKANNILSIQNLCIYKNESLLLKLDTSVLAGEILTIMGPSGSGKSTLLSWLSGMLEPAFTAKGKLMLGDQDITQTPSHLRRIALLFQDPLLFNHLTVAGNIEFGMPPSKLNNKKQRVLMALASVGLTGMESRAPKSLSGGQQARVALLRVLLNEPRVILLDEPFSKLDSQLRQATRQLVFEQIRKRGLTAILVTHDQSDAVAAAGKVIKLSNTRSEEQC
ncbi:MAG: putative thiamine transport system ATP-binding protein [Patiriisocius sp.]|jgi:putative thiamine transport system ATP-binding protein